MQMPMEERRSSRRQVRLWPALPLLLVVLALSVAGCSDPDEDPEARRAVPEPATDAAAGVTPAEYVTDFAFVGFAHPAPLVYYRLRNLASAETLTRRYRGWKTVDGDWRPLLAADDSLPVPRAGWRILPTETFRVSVERGGEVRSLVHREDGERFRILRDTLLLRWTGPTGQREALHLTRMWPDDARQDAGVPGLLLERRWAHPLAGQQPRGERQALLVADSEGNGVLVLRDTDPDGEAMARGWIDGRELSADFVDIEERDEGDGNGTLEWRVEIPRFGMEADLRAGPGPADVDEAGVEVRIRSLDGRLRRDGRVRAVSGLSVEVRRP